MTAEPAELNTNQRPQQKTATFQVLENVCQNAVINRKPDLKRTPNSKCQINKNSKFKKELGRKLLICQLRNQPFNETLESTDTETLKLKPPHTTISRFCQMRRPMNCRFSKTAKIK
jgi:hypothetical protein